jgi:hypothetical protein
LGASGLQLVAIRWLFFISSLFADIMSRHWREVNYETASKPNKNNYVAMRVCVVVNPVFEFCVTRAIAPCLSTHNFREQTLLRRPKESSVPAACRHGVDDFL